MKAFAALLAILAALAALCGCVPESPVPETEAISASLPTALPRAVIPENTFAPVPEQAPTETPEGYCEPTPTPEPTEVPEFEAAYKSAAYPLPPKSRRTEAGGMYPEEPRLNYDPNKFRCTVDLVNQCAFVYERDDSGNYTVLVREMIASCGTKDHPTPVGTFKMQNDYKRFGFFVRFDCYAQYWSLVVGRIYFHSIPYVRRDSRYLDVEGFYALGSPASHGCIRLLPDDAHWVYCYLCPGTTVQITNSRPFDRELRARLMLIELPVPDAYEIAPGG